MQWAGFYNLIAALGTIDKALTLLPIIAIEHDYLSKSVDDVGWLWIANMKITKYSNPTNHGDSFRLPSEKAPAPLYYAPTFPSSPFSRGSSTIPPQLDGIPNVSASRVTLRLLTALDDSTGAQGVEQSVAVTLYCRCPQTWGGDIVTTWIVPIQVNHVNFKMEQGWQRFHKVSVLKHCHGWNITSHYPFSLLFFTILLYDQETLVGLDLGFGPSCPQSRDTSSLVRKIVVDPLPHHPVEILML